MKDNQKQNFDYNFSINQANKIKTLTLFKYEKRLTKFAVAELDLFTKGFIHLVKHKNEKKEKEKHGRYFGRRHFNIVS